MRSIRLFFRDISNEALEADHRSIHSYQCCSGSRRSGWLTLVNVDDLSRIKDETLQQRKQKFRLRKKY
jgi:hypothetical protein